MTKDKKKIVYAHFHEEPGRKRGKITNPVFYETGTLGSNTATNDFNPDQKDIDSEVHTMSEDKGYDRYSELKEDLRESERRISNSVKEREDRFVEQMNRFAQDAKEREERFLLDNKEREDRINQKLEMLSQKFDDHAKHTETMKTQNFWGNIALFGAMLAIVITLLIFVLK
ncbi:hypothetical protein [Shouchella tritolerans]|uniref:hypothetical protein n=1 Tax=Shouchella tritolerans TaxID=2979466 RepID=UPI0021E71003|nr:hypothetical protein [Shouchella tritolerans]